mmetsp:Transcript_74956/g.242419  ORF Transcript_74956/g.242419 Transcript_74956/m.242419 type:complete len:211 (-) Transcript_74956:1087-1719(-)
MPRCTSLLSLRFRFASPLAALPPSLEFFLLTLQASFFSWPRSLPRSSRLRLLAAFFSFGLSFSFLCWSLLLFSLESPFAFVTLPFSSFFVFEAFLRLSSLPLSACASCSSSSFASASLPSSSVSPSSFALPFFFCDFFFAFVSVSFSCVTFLPSLFVFVGLLFALLAFLLPASLFSRFSVSLWRSSSSSSFALCNSFSLPSPPDSSSLFR